MWKYIKNYFSLIKDKKMQFKIPANYSIKIPNEKNKLSYIDKQFIRIILNFSPKFDNLTCDINRWDKHIDYMENIRAFIYCEVMEDNWNQLGKNQIELTQFIDYVRGKDADDFSSFLNLIDVDDHEYNLITDSQIVEKTMIYINEFKRDYQRNCDNLSKIYVSVDCSVNDYKIIWGNHNHLNLIMESHG